MHNLQDGWTCLHVAKSVDVVLMLIKSGAQVDVQNMVRSSNTCT